MPAMSLTRPPMLAGPTFRQRRPAISASSSLEVGIWAGRSAGEASRSRSAASGLRPGSGRGFMAGSTHGADGLPVDDGDKCTPAVYGSLREAPGHPHLDP